MEMSNISFIKAWEAKEQSEGVGAVVRRSIGSNFSEDLDPFIMLDHFRVQLPAGFPDHPHRGFETVTYMLEGSILHEDFRGHKGEIGPGDVQWMTAGRGIVHAEIPKSKDEYSVGLQLWINLDSTKKMIDPVYQEFKKDQVALVQKGKSLVKVISGSFEGKEGPVKSVTSVKYFDVAIAGGEKLQFDIDSGEINIFCYVYSGDMILIKGNKIRKYYNSKVYKKGGGVEKLEISAEKDSSFIIAFGKPIKEPKSSYGPFVMNNQKEIHEAIYDYQHATNGFEGAQKWKSEIRNLQK